jgi:ribosomal protein S18 acetylase RimI-like enzyme
MALLSRIPHRRHRAERERHMPTSTVRIAVNADDDRLVEAIIDQQEYERELHDTRLPGAQIGPSYLKYLKTKVAATNGALLVAELNGAFVGYAACWIEHDNNVVETEDSNQFGYVSDTYIVPQLRGRGLVASLLEAAEQCIRQNHELRRANAELGRC